MSIKKKKMLENFLFFIYTRLCIRMCCTLHSSELSEIDAFKDKILYLQCCSLVLIVVAVLATAVAVIVENAIERGNNFKHACET